VTPIQESHASRLWTRRDFLSASAAGAGLILLPGALTRCGGAQVVRPDEARALGASTGYFADLGVSEDVVRRTLGEAMSRGGDFADLFFNYPWRVLCQNTNDLHLRLQSGLAVGCGLRLWTRITPGGVLAESLNGQNAACAKVASG
jgi:hypothetical protein